jgi:RHS repeat-associated protein
MSFLGMSYRAANSTGKERDSESGLDNFGARYYSSAMGRFMSPDWSDVPAPVPYADLTNPQTLNLYGYVKNNPLRDADPTGHSGDDDIVDHILNAVVSAGVTFISDNLFGVGRPQPKSVEGQLGQVVGDFAAQQSGIAEAEAGTAGLTESGVMALVPGGQEVAAGDAVLSGAAVLHGTATAAIATTNLAKSAVDDSKYKPGADFSKKTKQEATEKAGQKCQDCATNTVPGKKSEKGVTPPQNEGQTDHIKPKSKGGTNAPSNAQHLCRKCNRDKSDKLPEQN